VIGRVLLTGATGFVGANVRAALARTPTSVRCSSRNPKAAAKRYPDAEWCRLDVTDPSSIREAVAGCDSAIYLVHSMSNTPNYADEERQAAEAFAAACTDAGVKRIVYLGGVAPSGPPSVHLKSRIETGRILRTQAPGVVELRAAMVIGHGSESWRICRDLATRLPLMVLPRWLRTRSCPVAIRDVVAAISHAALDDSEELPGCYDVPGPECISAEAILRRIAHLRGIEPVTFRVPVLSPRLSSYWLKLVTAADYGLARELIEGLTSDLLPSCPIYWERMDGYELQPFDDAAVEAFSHEALDRKTKMLEATMRLIARRYRGAPSDVIDDSLAD
jgi:uncharacterized protein YbjT (DUF2867 family)